MRIAFLGKGGSGKTTISVAYTLYLAQKKKQVLAIDGDVNMHMAPLLQTDQLWVHKHASDVQKYLEPALAEKGVPIIGTLPPTADAKYINVSKEDPFLKKYATVGLEDVPLLTVGTYESKDAGANCYHGKLQVLELMLHRLKDTKDQTAVCDMTAGIDALGTSLYMASDVNVFVVEPTLKSVQVYLDFAKAADEHSITTYALANKVVDQEDEKFLRQHIGEDMLIGIVPHSTLLRKIEQGEKGKIYDFVEINEGVFGRIEEKVSGVNRDYQAYMKELNRIYRLNCEWWYNDFYGSDLTKYIDESVNYEEVFAA
ncbi:hypothetical protein H6758_02355 [Candidatus Nomurabacteria bacterium]|nr:hypothetical protein [Candidatus Nomurabacteria bacterium]